MLASGSWTSLGNIVYNSGVGCHYISLLYSYLGRIERESHLELRGVSIYQELKCANAL